MKMNEMGMPREVAEDPAELNKEAINALYAKIADLNNIEGLTKEEGDLREWRIKEKKAHINALQLGIEMDSATKLRFAKEIKKAEVKVYDKTAEVDSFTLNDKTMWVDRELRMSLGNSIPKEQAAGRTNTSLWYDGVRYEMPITMALGLLQQLELYALECYNVTHSHLAAIDKLTTIEDVLVYDYKVGYPAKLVF